MAARRRGRFPATATAEGRRDIALAAWTEAGAALGPARGTPAELDEFFVDAAPAVVAALAELQTRAPEIADVVWLRCVAGLSLEDTAVVLGIRPRTVSKRWNLGRALLRRDLARLDPSDGGASR